MKKELIINDGVIKATKEVRIIRDGGQPEVMSAKDALAQAESEDKDLIMVSPTANPPVCKIMEVSKYMYDMQKKEKQQKKNLCGAKTYVHKLVVYVGPVRSHNSPVFPQPTDYGRNAVNSRNGNKVQHYKKFIVLKIHT